MGRRNISRPQQASKRVPLEGEYSPNQSSWPKGQVPGGFTYFKLAGMSGWSVPPGPAKAESGLGFENESVDSETQAAEEKQRRKKLRHQWHYWCGQGNLKYRSAVSTGKIMNYSSEQHVQKTAPDLTLSVRSRTRPVTQR
ncbi:MAG TPA: hypothetical protein VJO16_04990 [Candidatus Acidoferrum sp.]|nr:hypothetical protein [Candidatus Acidoferrum sp.]